MAARLQDIAISKNAGWSKVLTFCIDKARTPLPLTGYTGKCQLRVGESRTATLVAEVALTFEDRAAGKIKLALTLEQISAINVTEGFFDVLLAPVGGDPVQMCAGKMVFGDGVTVWP